MTVATFTVHLFGVGGETVFTPEHGLEVNALHGYIVRVSADGRPSITCLRCMQTSHHPKDVEFRYCGHCHVFHEDA